MENIIADVPKRVGVLVSGGADSALLLYMLCQAGHYCVPLTIDRTSRRHQLIHAVAVIGWVQRQFPGQIARHIIRQVSEDNIKEEREQAKKEIEAEYEIHTWVNGMTKNPPITFDSDQERDTRRDTNLSRRVRNNLKPFYNMDKRHIIELYHSLGIQELLDVSFSCEVSDPACRKCWWCEEREWAINEFSTNT